MAIDQAEPSDPVHTRLHGLMFGTLDTSRKLLTRIEQHLGLPVSDKSTLVGTLEEMASEATTTMMVALRAVEAKLADLEQRVVSPTKPKAAPKP